MESAILGYGIRNTALGIRNPTNDWNPEFKFHWQWLETNTWILLHGAKGIIGRFTRKIEKVFRSFQYDQRVKAHNCDRNLLPMRLIGIRI